MKISFNMFFLPDQNMFKATDINWTRTIQTVDSPI